MQRYTKEVQDEGDGPGSQTARGHTTRDWRLRSTTPHASHVLRTQRGVLQVPVCAYPAYSGNRNTRLE